MSWNDFEKDIESGPLGSFKWVVIAVVSLSLLFGILSFVMRPASMAVDRMVMKTSFQYKEGMEQRGAILEANIAEVDALLSQNPTNRDELLAQKRILSAQLRAITINK